MSSQVGGQINTEGDTVKKLHEKFKNWQKKQDAVGGGAVGSNPTLDELNEDNLDELLNKIRQTLLQSSQ